MGIDRISASPSIMPSRATTAPPSNDSEVTEESKGSGKEKGIVSKVESGFFDDKGVAGIRLRIAHSIENTGGIPEAPEHGPTKAYQKFLDQYKEQYPDPVEEGDTLPVDAPVDDSIEGVAQVDTLTVGGPIEEGDVFKITRTEGDTSTSVSAIATLESTVSSIVAELVAEWNAIPDTGIIAASIADEGAEPYITLTANTAGVGFIVSVATTEGDESLSDGQTFISETTTDASSAVIPVSSDGSFDPLSVLV
jgi:hypothetical protein